jgi:hypothetical protein
MVHQSNWNLYHSTKCFFKQQWSTNPTDTIHPFFQSTHTSPLVQWLDAFWVRTFPHKKFVVDFNPFWGQLVTSITSHAKGTQLLPDFVGTLHRPTYYPFKNGGTQAKTISLFHLGCLLAVIKFNHVHPTQEDRLPQSISLRNGQCG